MTNYSTEEIKQRIAAVPYWFHRIEVAPGIVTPGEDDTPTKFRQLQIPEDMRGKRVLDIGAYDGFFTFECERRGAEVLAIDMIPYGVSGFKTIHELTNSKAEFRNASIYDLNPEDFGTFDIVLCLGVIYHLRHPMLAIERLHSVCRGSLILETQICDQYYVGTDGKILDLQAIAPKIAAAPMAQFYPGAELNRDPSNWWSPNMPALEGMLRTCGFAPYKIIQNGVRACVHSQYVPGFVPEAIPASKGTSTGKADLPTITPNEVEQALPPTPEPPAVVAVGGEDELVRSYEASFIEAIEEDGSIYAPMTTVIQAGHERRMELLDRLPIGDISGKVCVDYGVGSWGFACIYPRLQQCGYAIGIDISEAAIQESAAISANGSFPYGQNYRYFTSRGTTIDLETGSVDIFFAGECIEHVENTEAFLDEVHRVLKPQGIFILTTPNADAYLFQSRNERYAVGPEHVALMGYNELVGYLKPRFSIVQANGFNGAMHPIFDDQINNSTVAKAWAAQFLDNPELGTGVVVMAQRNDHYTRHTYQQQIYHHSHPQISYQGAWDIVPLHRAMTGIKSHTIGDSLSLSFTGTGLILNFWTHDWSGIAEVIIDNQVRELNLYSPLGGFERLVVGDLPIGPHTLTIRITGNKDPRSNSHEIIFYQAISYTKN